MNSTHEAEVKELIIEAVVIRADGTREDRGTVSYWHRNPIKRWIHTLRNKKNG